MKSLAIWYEKAKGYNIREIHLDLHINFWKIPNQKVLDLGINIPDADKISAIYLYIPEEKLSKDNFDDLGGVISDKKLLHAVFNEDYGILDAGDNSKYINVLETENSAPKFSIYKIDKDSDLELLNKYHGSIFKIRLCNPKTNTYFRFRISGKVLDQFYNIEKPTNAIIQSAFTNTEILDFRINEKRNIDPSLIERELNNSSNGNFVFSKVRFFYMCPSNEEIISFSHGAFKRCRYLEKEVWTSYINTNTAKHLDNSKRFLAYQWNNDTPKKDINLMIKSKYEHNSKRTLSMYIVALSILTILLNIFSSYIFSWVHSGINNAKNAIPIQSQNFYKSELSIHNNPTTLSPPKNHATK